MSRCIPLALALVAGTGGASAGCSKTARHDPEERTMSPSISSPVSAAFQDKQLEKPPHVRLFLDVRMHNEAPDPRWFLLPTRVREHPSRAAGIIGASVLWLGPGRGASIGEFTGLPGFQAMLLPGGAEIQVRGLPITGELRDLEAGAITMDVVIASDLNIGGEPASAWFGGDPTCAAGTDVQWSHDHVRNSRDNPGFKGVPVSIAEERRVMVPVKIPRAQ
ncbi:hypothetical protein [Sorangium sp. So ce1182]|uniref:hypothetical protein n=1 Tax=Sorangium sp. So ce1182 TaxID=3133334 RepID=UPI003F6489B4